MRKNYIFILFTVCALLLSACCPINSNRKEMTATILPESVVSDARNGEDAKECQSPSILPYSLSDDFYSSFIDIENFENLKAYVVSSSEYVKREAEIAYQANKLWNELLDKEKVSIPADQDLNKTMESLYHSIQDYANSLNQSLAELISQHHISQEQWTVFVQEKVLESTKQDREQ